MILCVYFIDGRAVDFAVDRPEDAGLVVMALSDSPMVSYVEAEE